MFHMPYIDSKSHSPSCPKMASFGPEIQPAQQLTWQNGPYLEISRLTRILSSISSSSSSDRKKQQQGRSWPCFCNSVRHMQKFLAEWLIGAFAGKEALRSEMLHSSGYCTQPPDPCPAATPCSSTSSMSVYLQAHCMRAQKHTGTGNVPLPSLHSDLVNPPHAGGERPRLGNWQALMCIFVAVCVCVCVCVCCVLSV